MKQLPVPVKFRYRVATGGFFQHLGFHLQVLLAPLGEQPCWHWHPRGCWAQALPHFPTHCLQLLLARVLSWFKASVGSWKQSCLVNLLLWQDYLIVDKGKNMYLFLFLLCLFVLFSDYNEVLILSLTVSFWIKYPVYSWMYTQYCGWTIGWRVRFKELW